MKKPIMVVRNLAVVRLFSSPEILHTQFGPSNLLPATQSGIFTLKTLKIKDNLSSLPSAEVNNEWNSCVHLDQLQNFNLTCSVLDTTET
jgi:hypothetical protein